MDSVFSLVAIVLGLFVYLHASSLIRQTSSLIKLRFREPSHCLVERGEAGPERPALDAATGLMEADGFRYVGTRRVRSNIASASMPPTHTDLYYHQEYDVRADVCTANIPTAHWPYDIFLWDTFTDGSALLTVNRLADHLLTFPDSVMIADACAPNFSQQLAHHLHRRQDIHKERTGPADAQAIAQAMCSAMLPELVNDGKAYRRSDEEGEPVYSLRLGAAWAVASRMRAAGWRTEKRDALQEPDTLPPKASLAATQAAERAAFVRTLATSKGMRAPRWFRWTTFLVSALAFVALGTWWWDATFALVLVAVIAFHEGGHWLVMRLARFRDVQVFFLPGFGAATSGEKHDASPLTNLAVYLAGPVPGMLLAIAGICWILFGQPDTGAWWYKPMFLTIVIAFLVNVSNLAPVMPFDGGRVVDIFVMARVPWFRFAFALASGGFLLWLGFNSDSKIISGLGLLSLIVLPHQYRLATASRDLLRHTGTAALASGDFASSAGRLYDFLAQPQYQHWDFDSRMLIGQSILPRFLGRLPTVKETVIGLSIYLVCILAPLGAIALVAVEKPKLFNALSPLKVNAAAAPAPAMSFRQQAEIRLAAATGPLLRLSLLADIVKEAEQADETGDQLHFAKMLHAEAGERLPSTVQHASAALTLAKALRAQEDNGDDEKSWSEAARLLSEAESLLRAGLAKQDDSMAALILADVLVERQRGTGDEARIALLGEVVKLHADHALQSATRLPLARTGLAQALDEAGRTAQAEEQFRFAAVDIERLRQETKHGGDALALNHATFLMANDRSEEAMARLSRLLGKSVGLGSGYWSLERQAHLLAAVAARDRGDWRGVGDRAGAVKTVRELSGGNLLSPTYTEPRLDLRGALLLLEAERKLGRVQQAEELMAGVRAQYESKAGGARRCRSDDETDRWRKIITDAVAEIEKQEFNCEPTPALRQTGIVGDA